MYARKFEPWMSAIALSKGERVGDNLIFASESEAKEAFDKAGIDSRLSFEFETKAVTDEGVLNVLKAQFPSINFDKGKVFPCVAANTQLDRDVERFASDVLNLFAKQINEKPIPVCWQHNMDLNGLGRFCGASVVPSANGQFFDLKGYLWIADETRMPYQGERRLSSAVEDGSLKDVSIGFRAWGKYKEEVVNGENRYVYTYQIDPENPASKDAWIREISLVANGAQIGAEVMPQATKFLKTLNFEPKRVVNMTKTIEVDFNGTKYPLTITVEGDAITVKGESELSTAIKAATDAAATKTADLQKSIDELKAPFVADVVNAKVPGLDEATVKSFDAAKLIETAKAVSTPKGKAPQPATPQNFPQIFKTESNV